MFPGYREHRVLRISFWIKLTFVVIEVILAVAFAVCTFKGLTNAGAVIEWTIAFLFSLYVFSFYIDLYPAVYTRESGGYKTTNPQERYAAGRQMEAAGDRLASPPPTHGHRSGVPRIS